MNTPIQSTASFAKLSWHSLVCYLLCGCIVATHSLAQETTPAPQPTEEAQPAKGDEPTEAKTPPATSDQPAATTPSTPEPDANTPPKKAETPPAAEKGPYPDGRLPWESALPAKLPGKKLESVKEILQLLGIDNSQWRNFYQDRPFDVGEEEYINRVLLRIPRVGRDNLLKFRQEKWDPATLLASPSEQQGSTFLLRGRAKHIKKVALLEELAERYDFSHHYQVSVTLADAQPEAIVCVTQLPKAWPQEGELDEPVEIEGVFVKASPPPESQPEEKTKLIFVANNIIWLPEREDDKHGITADVLALVKHGFDAVALENIRQHNMKELVEQDTEPFYQLLHVHGKIPATAPELQHAAAIDIADCLRSPNAQPGKFVSVAGSSRRIDRIAVENAEMRQRFGIDHYYEIYVFVPLGEQRIKWGRNANDANPRIFENKFPVTVCVRELPPGLKAAPKLRENIQLQGSILKIWSYKPQGPGNDLPQPSPMVIANSVQIMESPKPVDSIFTNVVLGIMLLGLIGIFWNMFSQFRPSKPIARQDQAPVDFNKPAQ
jgi:hypothetical protein